MPQKVCILGSTGSIGTSALDVIRCHPGHFQVQSLIAHSNDELLVSQAEEFHPEAIALTDPAAAAHLGHSFRGIPVYSGLEAAEDLAGGGSDIVLCAMVGAVGLRPILRAIQSGSRIALANKEPLVMAGPLVLREAVKHNCPILPVDSEHSAIFQCIEGRNRDCIHRIHITASGGPFYKHSRYELECVTPEQAANHPTWNMGRKISVDSATLMNKGLEVIEAMWLFGVPIDAIQVVIHPQSIIHGMVEFTDGSILAHLGLTDMRLPIEYALKWPDRAKEAIGRLDLVKIGRLTFDKPDFGAFPCLALALKAARDGGTSPAVLNAANEVAVAAFSAHRIGFLAIPLVVEKTLAACSRTEEITLETVFAADSEARARAEEIINHLNK